MRANFLNFTKMQVSSLSQIVWLQLLGIVLFPMFFHPINRNNDIANVVIFATGLLMLSYLLLRNFMINDAKYKTKLLFSILPVTPGSIIGARSVIVYLFCLAASPLLLLFSNVTHLIRPGMFAVIQPHIVPYSLVLIAVIMPIEFLIFYVFEGQKADIVGAFAMFPYMGLMVLLYHYMMKGLLWIVVFLIAAIMNIVCFRFSVWLYKNKV